MMNNFDKMQQFLIDTKTPHTVKICNNSTSISVNKKTYFYSDNDKIDSKYLNFIKQVKREVCDNAERLNIKHCKPQYFAFNLPHQKKTVIKNAVEIDINGAYWQTAYNFGLITNETYEQGLLMPKKIRLMAFGSAATLKDVFVFDGENYSDSYNEFNQYGRNAFFAVANHVSIVMREALEMIPGVFSLFWVDAIFVHSMYQDFITRSLESAGYEYKIIPVPIVVITPGDDIRPDKVQMIVQKNNIYPFYERKNFQKHKKNNKKFVNKIIKNPLFARK